jgi:hypothetical protein
VDPAVQDALDRFSREPAPHQSPAVIRGALRDRLWQLTRDYPIRLRPDDESQPAALLGSPDEELGTGASPLVPEPDNAPRRFVEAQLQHLEEILYNRAGGCMYCHTAVAPITGRDSETLPAYNPTALPARWLEHARFRHASHRMLECQECHLASTSRHTQDVLLPALNTCARCHEARAGARNDCALCHDYHHHPR